MNEWYNLVVPLFLFLKIAAKLIFVAIFVYQQYVITKSTKIKIIFI